MAKDLYDLISDSSFYPGRLWVKRLGRLAVVFAIGINIFINDFQEYTLEVVETRSQEIASMSELIEAGKLNFDTIDRSSWSAYSYGYIRKFADFPDLKDINRAIEFSDKTLDNIKIINESLDEMDKGTTIAMKVLRYTSMLMWIPIVLSLIWLLIDLDKGKAQVQVGVGLLLSVFFNYMSYQYLCGLVGM